ncbi:MAG: hypothetical protein H7122_02820 [Chitinophagaceae bacterium]|nr:hypothetical protein [Chitinophagaceae bacterium]
MKKILKAYSILLIAGGLALTNTAIAGEEPKIEKKKTYSKSYNVGASEKVSFDNRFGELKITTWDKNEVKVDVSMTGKANTDERAQEILNGIRIEDGKTGSGVFFKTHIDNQDKKYSKEDKEKYRNEGFSINYMVYMPSRNPLSAKNEFGKTIIPDYTGEIEVESKFGSLTAGDLANVKRVRVEFGEASIESINNGQLNIHFSGKSIVNKLNGRVDVILEHSGGVKLVLENNVKEINIVNTFSNLYLDVNKTFSANFNINTNFGEFSNKTDFAISQQGKNDDSRGPKFKHQYAGKSGSGTSSVRIQSEFGQVIVGHNLEMKVAEKNKEKKKTRSI